MKKICFVTTTYGTFYSFLKGFSKYLFENGGYEVHLICSNDERIENDLPNFVTYHQVSMKRGISLSGIFDVFKIKKIFKENKFDIIQYSTPNAAFYASLASKMINAPVRLYCQWGIRYMGFKGLTRFIFKMIEKMTCKCSTFIEAESHNIRDFSLKERLYSDKKSAIIWNGSACGVDLEKFDIKKRDYWRKRVREQYGFSDNDTVFAFAGRLTAEKGIDELLEAFLALNEEYPLAKLMIMGRDDNIGSLNQKLFAEAKMLENVIFTGNVDDIEIYYSAADVFVAPSYREGFGLVVVEAQTMGLPAIVSDVPGQIDAIKPEVTGITCKVKDAESLKNAMTRMICEKNLREQMSAEAVKFATENFEQEALFGHLMSHRNVLAEAK